MYDALISVVTICYNAEKGIGKTINSIVRQEYSNFDYFIIDGKSTDKTVDIAKEITAAYGIRAIIISEKDGGIYNAMNKALDIVDGEWVIFMNAGDTFYDENVLKEFATGKYEADFIYGDTNYVNVAGHFIVKANSIQNIRNRMPFCHQAVFNRADVIKKIRFDERYCIAADYNCYFRAYLNGYKFMQIPLCVCSFEEGGVSTQAKDTLIKEIRDIQIRSGITRFPRLKYVCRYIRVNMGRVVRRMVPASLLNKIRQAKYS